MVEAASRDNNKFMKPKIVMDYNLAMGGVDRADQNMVYYNTVRKRMRVYYKKIFRHIIDQCVFNAFTIQKKRNGRFSNLLDFRLQLVEALLEKYYNPEEMKPTSGRKSVVEDPIRLTARHFPSYIPATACKKEPSRKCVVCCSQVVGGKKIRKESRYWCVDCKVGLCAAPCFEVYYTKKNF